MRSELPAISADLAVRWLGMGSTWLLSIGAGISLLIGHGGGLYLLAFGMLLGIALLVAAAWTLVVETGQHAGGKDIMPSREQPAELPGAGQIAGGKTDLSVCLGSDRMSPEPLDSGVRTRFTLSEVRIPSDGCARRGLAALPSAWPLPASRAWRGAFPRAADRGGCGGGWRGRWPKYRRRYRGSGGRCYWCARRRSCCCWM
jgi:hypothetical protein